MAVGWAVFRNYVGHAKEIYGDITDYPRFFLMPPTALVEADEHGNNVVALSSDEDHIDHEVELVIRLGEDLEPVEMCVGNDTTTGLVRPSPRRRGGHGLRGRVSLARECSGPGLLGTRGRLRSACRSTVRSDSKPRPS
ncbi:MAG: hypothetical protein Ct9H300mP10_10270 [Methanobacteriota archaeon]|nr:MAG: hypothetical protein Ct9H300mP10_10270 [Euryarchaeota archaeon]